MAQTLQTAPALSATMVAGAFSEDASASHRRSTIPGWVGVLLALISAVVCSLSFTSTELGRLLGVTIDLGFLAWFGLVPYIVALKRTGKWGFFFSSAVFGAAFVGFSCAWLGTLHQLGLAALCLCCAVHYWWTGLFVRVILRRHGPWAVITGALTWIFFDWLMETIFFKFPWFYLGYSQINTPWVAQTAELTGVWGITFLLIASNIALASIFLASRHTPRYRLSTLLMPVLLVMAIIGGALAFGANRVQQIENAINHNSGPIVAMIQPAVPQGLRVEQLGKAANTEEITNLHIAIIEALQDHPHKGRYNVPLGGEGRPANEAGIHDSFLLQRIDDGPIDLVCFAETTYPLPYEEYLYYLNNPDVTRPWVFGATERMLAAVNTVNGAWTFDADIPISTPLNPAEQPAPPPALLWTAQEWAFPEMLADVPKDKWREEIRRSNSATLVGPDLTNHGRYSKIELVPIGESVPLRDHTTLFRDATLAITKRSYVVDLVPGEEYTVFDLEAARFPTDLAEGSTQAALKQARADMTDRPDNRHRFGVTVCFESAFAEIHRRIALQDAAFVMSVSNDGWFIGIDPATNATYASSELEQIWSIARMRAIETRMAYARSVNSGITGLCGPDGQMVSTLYLPAGDDTETQHPALGHGLATKGQMHLVPGVLVARVPVLDEQTTTLYEQLGPYLPLIGFIAMAWSIAFALVRRKR